MSNKDRSKNEGRPVNKTTMDQPQEEFIEAEANQSADKEHGSETDHAIHQNRRDKSATVEQPDRKAQKQ